MDVLIDWYFNLSLLHAGEMLCPDSFTLWLVCDKVHGFLSPCLFAVFIDYAIKKLRVTVYMYGAYTGRFYFGCMLYADDIVLVCYSVSAMQKMLDILFTAGSAT